MEGYFYVKTSTGDEYIIHECCFGLEFEAPCEKNGVTSNNFEEIINTDKRVEEKQNQVNDKNEENELENNNNNQIFEKNSNENIEINKKESNKE